MSSVGTILDSLSRMRGNHSLLNKRSANPFGLRKLYLEGYHQAKVDFRKASPEEMEAIRQRVKATLRKQKIRNRRVVVLSLIITAALLGGLSYLAVR